MRKSVGIVVFIVRAPIARELPPVCLQIVGQTTEEETPGSLHFTGIDGHEGGAKKDK